MRETTAVEVDPELLSWVSDFVHAKERVTIEDVSREFFPRSTTAPRLYLGQLVADRVIEYKARQQVYEWAYRSPRRRKPKVASNDHGYL